MQEKSLKTSYPFILDGIGTNIVSIKSANGVELAVAKFEDSEFYLDMTGCPLGISQSYLMDLWEIFNHLNRPVFESYKKHIKERKDNDTDIDEELSW